MVREVSRDPGDIEAHIRELIRDVTNEIDEFKEEQGSDWLRVQNSDGMYLALELIKTLNGLHANLLKVVSHTFEYGSEEL